MTIRKYLPDFLTAMNLVCGLIALTYAFGDRPDIAFYLMLAAAVFDFSDGFAARALKAYSDLGKELDSLCDLVSFGVLPAVMLHRQMVQRGRKAARLLHRASDPGRSDALRRILPLCVHEPGRRPSLMGRVRCVLARALGSALRPARL